MKVIINSEVAGGTSYAARLRRLDENTEIVMAETIYEYTQNPNFLSVYACRTNNKVIRLLIRKELA